MSGTAYVNGRYLPYAEAGIHVEDRGFLFADGVYEVVPVVNGRLMNLGHHLERLARSLSELRIAPPVAPAALPLIMAELLRRNRLRTGRLYLQVTRGSSPRDFKFPKDVPPSLVMVTRSVPLNLSESVDQGVAVVSVPDIRWLRRDIKSVSLLPQVLAKQAAAEAGAFEAWMVDAEGFVTEGASSNAWIVTADGALATRPADNLILSGVTRRVVLDLVERLGLRFKMRAFSLAEAAAAREAFVTSAGTFVLPVASLDGRPVGDGRPGPVALGLRRAYLSVLKAAAGLG